MSEEIYTESIFMDSGAHGLYNRHVLKPAMKGKHGRMLEEQSLKLGYGDFSYYSLKPGKAFRKYCDAYAEFVKKYQGKGELYFVMVDVIGRADLTWQVHKWFREEHGLHLVPVVHYGTEWKDVERYLNLKECDLLGVGGPRRQRYGAYLAWADDLFLKLCPVSNKRLPIVRTHGFAVTGWQTMCRYPWWSVDSATWVKLSAYGWIYFPPYHRGKWRFDKAPRMVSFSATPPKGSLGRRTPELRDSWETAVQWLQENGLELGHIEKKKDKVEVRMHDYNGKPKPIKTFNLEGGRDSRWAEGTVTDDFASAGKEAKGVCSHYVVRSIANLIYFKRLEQSRPKWPWPLDLKKVDPGQWAYDRGFDL